MQQVYHLQNWVYTAVHCICSKVASVFPNMAYVTDQPKPGLTVKASRRHDVSAFGGTQWFSHGPHSWLTMGALRSKALSVVKPHEELEPLEHEHPCRRLWDNPNPYDTSFDLTYEFQMFDELCGVDYTWKVPNDWGKPAELWVLPSHWVWPKTGGGRYVDPQRPDAEKLIWYYEVRPWGGTYGSAGMLKIPPNEIIFNKWKSPLNKIDGYSKLGAIAQWIDSEESISASRWSQFQNQARPELWIELGAGYEDPTDDRIARIEAKIAAKLQGEYNYGKPIITPNGAKVTPLSFNPTEMAYFDSESQIRDMILAAFGVPKTAIGLQDEMTYGSLLASLGQFCANCLNPRLAERGQRLTKDLASAWDEATPSWSTGDGRFGGNALRRHVRIWYDDCVPADPQQVNSDIDQDLRAIAIAPDEVRALRGRKPWPRYGDVPWTNGPGGMAPYPINGDSLDELAEDLSPIVNIEKPDEPAGMLPPPGEQDFPRKVPGADNLENGDEQVRGSDDDGAARGSERNGGSEGAPDTDLAADSAGIQEPNQKPSKAWRQGPAEEELTRLARVFLAEKGR